MIVYEAILDHLFGPASRGEVYAILDAARDERILPNLFSSGLEHVCLYSGAIPKTLAEVAPYLVRLQPWHPFTQWLMRAGWAQSWGVFLTTRASKEELRLHLRRFLLVKDERGKILYFRYYDPRVLRLYLPTCTDAERNLVFGPIDSWFCESPEGHRLLTLSADGSGGELLVRQRWGRVSA